MCYINVGGRGGAADTGSAVEPTSGKVHYKHLNFIHPGQPILMTLMVKLLFLVEVSNTCV